MRRVLACAGVVLAAAPAGAQPDRGLVEHADVDVAPAGRAFKTIAVDNPLGDVRVEGYDGKAIRIESIKHAPDDDSLERLRVSLVPNPDGTVRIATTAERNPESRPIARAAVRIDLVIHAPRDARIDAEVTGGKLDVEGMDAGGELDAASGAITVRDVSGELWTHTVSGATSLAEVFGSIDAATISADLDLDTIGGDRLVASTNHGQILGRRVRARDIELTTVEGRIVLEAEAALRGRIVLATLRGDIDVRLHRHGGVVVRATGSRVDLGPTARAQPDGWMGSTFGQGAMPTLIELRSRYGTVRFVALD